MLRPKMAAHASMHVPAVGELDVALRGDKSIRFFGARHDISWDVGARGGRHLQVLVRRGSDKDLGEHTRVGSPLPDCSGYAT